MHMRNCTVDFLKPLAVVFLLLAALSAPAFALSRADENLIYHANFGEPAKIAELLHQGANPNAISTEKWPVVSLAALRADDKGFAIVKLLVEAGADLNVRDANGETPLMNAISINNADMVKYMIERGADFHAVNQEGRTVQQFALHYGNERIAFLVSEAIRLEEKRIREGRSRKRMYRMLDDYIYYTCAYQYIAYNKATALYDKERLEDIDRLQEQVYSRIGNAQVELEHNFRMKATDVNSIGANVGQQIFAQLEALISNRNRKRLGVGKDTDLDKRCKDILELWRKSYQQYEEEGRITEQ